MACGRNDRIRKWSGQKPIWATIIIIGDADMHSLIHTFLVNYKRKYAILQWIYDNGHFIQLIKLSIINSGTAWH